MKSLFLGFSLFFLCTLSYSQASQEISGRVTQMGQPLSNVNIIVDQTDEGTFSDKSGYYKIKTQAGSTLNFTHTGMRTVKIIVEDVTKILNIEMEPEYEQLDEVTVMKRKKLGSQKQLAKDYRFDKDIIKTRFGFSDTKKASWRVTVIDEEKLKVTSGLDLTLALDNWFIGVVDRSDPANPKFYDGRTATITEIMSEAAARDPDVVDQGKSRSDEGFGKEAMIFDVDGQIFENFPVHLTNTDVDRIAIIPGNMAASTYGMQARGGVIVINTKGANMVYEKDSFKVYDYERLRNNFYIDDTTALRGAGYQPNYMVELQKATNKEEGLKIYKEQQNHYGSSPFFKLNVADYFLKSWRDPQIADNILEEVASDFSKNPAVLKALAYLYDERQEWEKSAELYKQILRLRPKYAQSYRDLANSFGQARNYSTALGMYVRYGRIKEVNPVLNKSMGIDSIIESEYENISALHGQEIFGNKSVQDPIVWGARVLLEWNNGEAEFEIQTIHPNTQFFTINHTNSSNPKRIENEKIKGYSSEQIWFDHNDIGTWNINLKYQGNKSYDPTYFKITLYRDWGLPTQSKEIKVFRMEEKYKNQNVLRFTIAGSFVNK